MEVDVVVGLHPNALVAVFGINNYGVIRQSKENYN